MVRVLAGFLLLYAAWEYYNLPAEEEGDGAGLFDSVGETISQTAGVASDYVEGALGMFNLSKMRQVTPAMLENGNVRAFLRVIRAGEGTSDEGGYSRLYGGGSFSGFADHPRKAVKAGAWTSTAAGAYQFLARVWDETARIMGLSSFSPGNQDLAAVGRIAARGALGDVMAGRFASAVRKCAWEWASLPGSPYGQPTISQERAQSIYASAGGSFENVG